MVFLWGIKAGALKYGGRDSIGEKSLCLQGDGSKFKPKLAYEKSLCQIVMDYPLIDMGIFLWLNNDMFGYGI